MQTAAISPAAAAGESPLLSDSAVYSNALWLAESPASLSPSSAAAPSSLRQPLKSLTAAAAHVAAGGPDVWRGDDAHLVAAPASRAASFDEQRLQLPLASKGQAARGGVSASLDISSSSPRIGAVTLRHSSSSLGALVRQMSQRLLPGGRAQDSRAAAAVAAAPSRQHDAPAAHCPPAAEASDGGSDVMGILPHVSPGHLLAPAQPSLWAASPPPVQLQLMAAGDSWGGNSTHQQGDGLLLDLLDDFLPAAQPAAEQRQQLSPQQQDETAALLLPQQLSDLSSPTSGAYSPAAAAGRNLGGPANSAGAAPASSTGTSWQQQREAGQARSLAHPIFALQPGEAAQPAQPDPAAGLQALLAAQRRQGQEASPGSLLVRPAPLATAAAEGAAAAPCEPAEAQPLSNLHTAWSLGGGHVELDLDLLEGLPQAAPAAGTPSSTLSLALAAIPAALPAAAGGWDHSSAHPLLASPQLPLEHQHHDQEQRKDEEEQQQCWVLFGPSMANQYTPMVLRFEQLDTRRIRRAVKASLKRQAAEAAAQQPRPSLFRRLTRGCLSGSTADQPLRLRKDLDKQRLQLLCLGRLPYSPDDPLHFELWQAVCWGFTGMDAIEEHPSEMMHGLPAWQLLGFRAANPASSLGGAGVLPLLMLLLGLDYASHLAARLLHLATAGALLPPHAHATAARLPPFSLADVAVEVTRWTLHTLAGGGLNLQAQRLGSTTIAAELFWLGAAAEFVDRWEAAEWHADPQRLLLSVLVQAQQAACGDVRSTVERHLRQTHARQ